MMQILAKSLKNGGWTLLEHSRHVMLACERLADALGLDPTVARNGAVLHDLGKAHPAFQAQLTRDGLSDPTLQDGPFRHEIASLLFLPLFPKAQWSALIEMVVAHHKSIEGDKSERGLLDLINRYYGDEHALLERHAMGWDAWMPHALEVVRTLLGVDVAALPLRDGQEAFLEAVRYCEGLKAGWSPWRGLLMAADHLASAYEGEILRVLPPLYQRPNVEAAYGPSSRFGASALYPLSMREAETNDARPHTLVIAPTGAGKTNFLFRRCRNRVFYTLPYQASINAMFLRVRDDLERVQPGVDVRRVHASSRMRLRSEADDALFDEDAELQRHPGAAVKIMTPFQLAGLVFGLPGHEALRLDVRGQDVILDEVHTYDTHTRTFLLEMVRVLAALGCRIHVGSATLPDALYALLLDALGGADTVCEVRLSAKELGFFNRHIVHHVADQDEAWDVLQGALRRGERVLVVCNAVKRARDWYDRLNADPETAELPKLLIHSRFRRMDRARLEQDLYAMERADGPCVAISTQVVEVSLDLSFDTLITECAPLDALVQRFGRVHRRRREGEAGTSFRPVYVIAPPDADKDLLPYRADVVRRSFAALPETGTLLEETSLQHRISQVYPTVETPPIDVHLAVRDGHCTLPLLQHRSSSVLLQALEIDPLVGVLVSDQEAYAKAGPDRSRYEIPLPKSAFGLRLQRLPLGNWPLLVPEERYDERRGFLETSTPAEPSNTANFL